MCKRLMDYIYVIAKHVQMSATTAFLLQTPAPAPGVGVMPHPMLVCHNTPEAPPLSFDNDDLCSSCKAVDKRSEQYCVMPCHYTPQYTPHYTPQGLQRADCVPSYEPEAPKHCVLPVVSGCNTQYIPAAASAGSIPQFYDMQHIPHVVASAGVFEKLHGMTSTVQNAFMPHHRPPHVVVKVNTQADRRPWFGKQR